MTESEKPDSRQFPRWKVFEVAAIHAGDMSAPCVIDDISEGGVLVTSDLELQIGQIVTLELEELGEFQAEVRHIRRTLAGLSLQLSLEEKAAFKAWLEGTEKEDR